MDNLHQLASNLHLLLCNKPHNPNVEDISKMARKKKAECYWYLERQLESRWEERDHKEWLKLAEELSKEDPKALISIFSIKMEIESFIKLYPMLEGILKRAISPLVK